MSSILKIRGIIVGSAVLVGLFVSVLGWMTLFGYVIESNGLRLLFAAIVCVGAPALVSDQLLKRVRGAGFPFVVDVFALTLMTMALLFAATAPLISSAWVREGDRQTEDGSSWVARPIYLLGGRSPTFPTPEEAALAAASASASVHPVDAGGDAR
jgi:hypothetical protein